MTTALMLRRTVESGLAVRERAHLSPCGVQVRSSSRSIEEMADAEIFDVIDGEIVWELEPMARAQLAAAARKYAAVGRQKSPLTRRLEVVV